MTEDKPIAGTSPEAGGPRPLDFSTFLLSLGTSALVQLGEAPDPTSGISPPADLASARQTIDLLGILEKKTEGNLTESESNLLRHLLRDLRIHYISKSEKD